MKELIFRNVIFVFFDFPWPFVLSFVYVDWSTDFTSKMHNRPSKAVIGSAGVLLLVISFFLAHQLRGPAHRNEPNKLVDSSEGGPRVRQATMSLHDGFQPIFERALKSHIRHGEAWGYPTDVLRHSMLDGNSQYNKISYLQMLLLNEMAKPYGERALWIVSVTPLLEPFREMGRGKMLIEDLGTNADAYSNSWFDVDTVLLNPKVPWTIFLPPSQFPNIHLLAVKNWDGFNSGVFFLHVHEWSVKMLADALAIPSLLPEIPIRWADQTAMLESFSRPQFREGVLFQPVHWYNEFQIQQNQMTDNPNVHPGDMLIHFAGIPTKSTLMESWLDKVENTPERWAVPLENTSYPEDVTAFWETYGRAKDLLDRANDTLSSELGDAEIRTPVVRAYESLETQTWESPDDLESMRGFTESLSDALRLAEEQERGTLDQQMLEADNPAVRRRRKRRV